MEAVRDEALRVGDRRLESRALTALADVTLLREADCAGAAALADQALAVVEPNDLVARFDALQVRTNAAWWGGDLTDAESYLTEQLEVAREAGRKDLESIALRGRGDAHRAKLELTEAKELLTRALELAEESGAIASRGWVFLTWARIHLIEGDLAQAVEAAEEAKRLSSEAGAVWAIARALNVGAWAAWWSGDLEKGEKRFRESIRLLKPLGDRAALWESQRGLAELMIERGRQDEAARHALEARETVGPQDMTSIATTMSALGLVRAAQGRDEEAEELLRSAVDHVAGTDFAEVEHEMLLPLAQFLRERGREDEAAVLEERRDELFSAAKSSARIA
jgi:tetratricopeptide (TPR) repeat protein